MPTLSILMIEDIEGEYGWWSQIATHTLGGPDYVEIERARDLPEALSHAPGKFDAVIVDVYLQGAGSALPVADGIEFVKIANSWGDKRPLLIILSNHLTAAIDAAATAAGADLTLDKRERNYGDLDTGFRAPLRKAFEQAGLIEANAKKITFGTDLPDRVIWESIGEATVLQLIEGFDSAAQTIELKALSQGFSGAYIIAANCGPPADQRLVIKVSRDRVGLESEIARAPAAGDVVSPYYLAQVLDKPVEADGWYAIGSTQAARAETLEEWLRAGKSKSRASAVAETVLQRLSPDHQRRKLVAPDGIDDLFGLWVGSRYRIVRAIEELTPSIARAFDVTQLELMSEVLVGDRPLQNLPVILEEDSTGVYVTWCHGDLHSRNILVDNDDNPWFVDPALRRPAYWPSDTARLSSDLWLSLWNPEDRFHWDGLEACLQQLLEWCSGNPAGSGSPVATMLDALWAGMPDHFDSAWSEDGFRLGMAAELAKLSSHASVAPPRRALGLLGAAALLEPYFG